ncbi:MAG: arylamine N-acetyltransferase [Candidatus Eremiobacteraeota bacterium]|nr:arylamine N-acetyltransferase [Candidatus Eremiobacteraeota bacterium]MCW5865988.1 arylamine N-acetyltransferase [Candidatus Eremiobacteraeota bacterium]
MLRRAHRLIEDYLRRIGQTKVPDLSQLVRAHLSHIPFENLSVLAGQPVWLDDDSLLAKLIRQKRGGYCFEQNTLFQRVLEKLGYELTPLQARVRRGVHEVRPNTHKLLRVRYHDQDYLVDVGFGGEGPSRPLPWGTTQEFQPGVKHRMVQEDGLWVLQNQHDGEDWVDLYATDNRRAEQVDYEMANWFTSTHPGSLFVNSMLVSLHHETGYMMLFDGLLRRRRNGVTHQTRLQEESEIRRILEDEFDLTIPPGMRVPLNAAPASRHLL